MEVRVGIFWVIDGEVYSSVQVKNTDEEDRRSAVTGKLDSDLGHFEEWDKLLANKYLNADFATFPRGRVMYDLYERMHVIYADKCVSEGNINEIKRLFDITDFKLLPDEHYQCDKCIKSRKPPYLIVDEFADCFKISLSASFGIMKRTLIKGEKDEFAFEDILSEVNIETDGDNSVCRFTVDDRPSEEFDKFFYDNTGVTLKYNVRNKLSYEILDGENKIGANLLEIKYRDKSILVDAGCELEPTEEGVRLRETITKKHYDACIITHYHSDHAGLLKVPLDVERIYMGESTFKILKVIEGICQENIERIHFLKDSVIYWVDGISFRPFLCDHSAYDSYMIEFYHGKSAILYTGDFRANGRKSFQSLLKRLPSKVNTIICEGTNKNKGDKSVTENELENMLMKEFDNDRPVFVLQSATNIDRIVTMYRAALKSGRKFIMRLIQADICSELPNIPSPNGYDKCYVYTAYPLSKENHDNYAKKYGKRFVGRDSIAQKNDYVMQVTSNDLQYLQKLSQSADLRGAKLIYSMWRGYKDKEDMKAFLKGIENLGIQIVDLHVSGHADEAAISALLKHVQHDECKFIHSEFKG